MNAKDYRETVERLADRRQVQAAMAELAAGGKPALDAAVEGLSHPNWEVRRWCAAHMDHHADNEALQRLALTLNDPKARVRLWAVHSISCAPCKPGPYAFDATPLLLKRLQEDKAIRVRRMAALMLAMRVPDRRVARVFRRLAETETDERLLKHLRMGLEIYSGKLAVREDGRAVHKAKAG